VALAGDGSDAFGDAGDRAAQRRLDAFREGGEIGLAVERRIDRAAHQRGAAEAGQHGACKPLHGYAATIEHAAGATFSKQRRVIAEIDSIRLGSPIWAAQLAVVQDAVPCAYCRAHSPYVPATPWQPQDNPPQRVVARCRADPGPSTAESGTCHWSS